MRNLIVAENDHLKNKYEERDWSKPPSADKLFLTALKDAIGKSQVKLLKGTPAQAVEFFSNFDEPMYYAPFLDGQVTNLS